VLNQAKRHLIGTACWRLTNGGSPEAKADVLSAAKNAVLSQGGLIDGSGLHHVHGIPTCDGYGG